MDMYGTDRGRDPIAELEYAHYMPQGAVLLEAEAGLLRTALRASPGATLGDTACVLFGWLASALHPCCEGQTLPDMHDAALAYCLWAGPHAWLGMQDTLASALRHSGTLYLFYGGNCVTVTAYLGVDATGMRDRVEVVGAKYDVDIGGFDAPPYVPTPVKLEESQSGARLTWACGGGCA